VRDWHHLTWSMLLLHAIRRGGLEEVDSLKFHRLQFFSNSLAPIYKTQPPIELVMKLERGPFYPDAQDDIDMLCVCGFASVRDVKWHAKGNRMWKTAIYGLTTGGFERARQLSVQSLWCEQIGEFLNDLVMAYSDLDDAVLDQLALKDLTYAQKGKSFGDVIPFTLERNFSVRGTRAIASMLPPAYIPNRRNQLRMYMKYLEQLVA
jgi:hypothetical protein